MPGGRSGCRLALIVSLFYVSPEGCVKRVKNSLTVSEGRSVPVGRRGQGGAGGRDEHHELFVSASLTAMIVIERDVA